MSKIGKKEYIDYKVKSFEDVENCFKHFKLFNNSFDYENGMFEARYIFQRSDTGSFFTTVTRTRWDVIKDNFENAIYDDYGDSIDYDEVKPVMVSIKYMDPCHGKGKKFIFIKRVGNNIYTMYFSNSRKRCLIISSIKYMNPELRDKSAKELRGHSLMIKGCGDFYNQIKCVEDKYKRTIKILSTEKQLESLTDEDLNKNIVLYSIGYHIGYVIKGVPEYHYNPKESKLIQKRKYEKKLYALVWFDCEWSYEVLNDDEIISKDSNLICCITVIKGKTIECSFSSFTMFFNHVKYLSKNGLVYCYSHNGGKVEHILLLKSMIQDFGIGKSGEYDLVACNGTQIKTLKYGSNLVFFDSLLLLSLPVEKLPEVYGLSVNKGHKEWPEGKCPNSWYRNKTWSINNPDDIEYCMNDVRIIKEAMEITNNSLKPLVKCLTVIHPDGYQWVLGNTSISSIGKQTIFNTFPTLPNSSIEKGLFLEVYYGGRCEMFYHGLIESDDKNFIAVTDKVSMYPSVVQQPTPGKLLKIQKTIPDSSDNIKWAMDVVIKYKKYYKIPPICRKVDSVLIAENYDSPTLLFMWDFEYENLKDNIEIIEIKYVYIFDVLNLAPIFSSWYERKKKAKTPTEKVGPKILMNGTTGGFGQRFIMPQRTLTKNISETVNKRKLYKYTYYDAFDDWNWLIYDDYVDSKTCYQLIAYITAKSRFKLWMKMNELQKIDENSQILYCDTDSIFIKGNKKLMDYMNSTQSDELESGWDFKQIKKIYIRGLKKYMYYDINDNLVKKISGLSYKNMDNISFEEFQNDNIETKTEKWMRTRDNKIKIENKNINFGNNYEKGEISDSGVVLPFFSTHFHNENK